MNWPPLETTLSSPALAIGALFSALNPSPPAIGRILNKIWEEESLIPSLAKIINRRLPSLSGSLHPKILSLIKQVIKSDSKVFCFFSKLNLSWLIAVLAEKRYKSRLVGIVRYSGNHNHCTY